MNTYLLTFFIYLSFLSNIFFNQTSVLMAQTDEVQTIERQEQSFDGSSLEPVRHRSDPSQFDSDPLSTHLDPFETDSPVPTKETDSFQTKFLNMLLILGLLIGFMILASWMLKRMTRTRADQVNQSSSIRVLETRSLSPRSTIYLLDIRGQGIVVAETPTTTSHLATISLEDPGIRSK